MWRRFSITSASLHRLNQCLGRFTNLQHLVSNIVLSQIQPLQKFVIPSPIGMLIFLVFFSLSIGMLVFFQLAAVIYEDLQLLPSVVTSCESDLLTDALRLGPPMLETQFPSLPLALLVFHLVNDVNTVGLHHPI